MASLNRVEIIGNLGKDPEMRFTPAGKAVVSFSVAVANRYKKGDEWVDDVDWFNVIAWNKLAEACNQKLSKGQSVYVEGRVKKREWEGKDGSKHSSLDITANTVLFLDKKATAGAATGELEEGDVPF